MLPEWRACLLTAGRGCSVSGSVISRPVHVYRIWILGFGLRDLSLLLRSDQLGTNLGTREFVSSLSKRNRGKNGA